MHQETEEQVHLEPSFEGEEEGSALSSMKALLVHATAIRADDSYVVNSFFAIFPSGWPAWITIGLILVPSAQTPNATVHLLVPYSVLIVTVAAPISDRVRFVLGQA